MVAKQATQGQWNSTIILSLIRSSVTPEENNIISGRNLKQEKKTPIITIFFLTTLGIIWAIIGSSQYVWMLWIHSR